MADRTDLFNLESILSEQMNALQAAQARNDTHEVSSLEKQIKNLETEINNIKYNLNN